MRVLFAALHLGYLRNFESVVTELVARGHQVHLTGDEPDGMGGEGMAVRLAETHPLRITWDRLPTLDAEPWYDATRRLRVSLDYVRALEPRYPRKMRLRGEERTARVVRGVTRVPGGRAVARAALIAFERAMPAGGPVLDYVRRQAPDLIVLATLTYSRSQQMDLLKAAKALRIPVAVAVMSWDHLSSKALLHVPPDMVLLWNDVQRREAVEMHGLPAERIVETGAQCYDQWFTRTPERSREAFCRAVGLRPDRPFVLWVHSAFSPVPDPPEPTLVVRWIDALRRSPDPRLRELGVLVRPHPERRKEWADVQFDRWDNVAFHGRNPIDPAAKDDYFDSLYYSGAVVGLLTSAFLEAAIVGRPVLTFTLPEYQIHREEMIHFQYLMTVAGGLLHSAPDVETHLEQLAEAVSRAGARDDRNRRFLAAFVRPHGLDTPATPRFVDALERLHREGSRHEPLLQHPAWVQRFVIALAAWSRTGLGRWLVKDERADARDEQAEEAERIVMARVAAKEARRRNKVRHRERRIRRDALMRTRKKITRALRFRHRIAVTLHRVLHILRLWRGDLPGRAGDK